KQAVDGRGARDRCRIRQDRDTEVRLEDPVTSIHHNIRPEGPAVRTALDSWASCLTRTSRSASHENFRDTTPRRWQVSGGTVRMFRRLRRLFIRWLDFLRGHPPAGSPRDPFAWKPAPVKPRPKRP